MEYTGAELVVEGLKAAGIRFIFGVSGSDTLPVLDVIYRTPQLRYLQAQHEQGGIFMANGYARIAREVGVSLVSPGPGATNSLTGVAQAIYTSTPSVLICIEETSRFTGLGTSQHHDLDSLKVFSPVTKWAGKVSRSDRLLEGLHTALRVAFSGRKGPCFLAIHKDLMEEKIEVDRVGSPFPLPNAPRGNPDDIEKMATLLENARKVVILAGGGVWWARAQEEVLELAGLLSAPVATTCGHKGLIAEDHPLSVGMAGTEPSAAAIKAFREADFLLAIGSSLAYFRSVPRSGSSKLIGPHLKIGHIDIDPAEIGKIYPADAGVVGDARLVLQDLVQALKQRRYERRKSDTWLGELAKVKHRWERQSAPLRNSDRVPIRSWRLMSDLRKALPRDAIVAAESGGTHGWFEYAFQGLVPSMVGGWHPLGAEVCEALGAKVAAPDRPVVCITGDGSMMMAMAEIATAVANKIPVLYVVRHNNAFGNMRKTQIVKFGSRFIGTDLPVPNLANVASELGARGERIENPDQIIPAVQRFLRSNQPTLLDVICDNTLDELVPPKLEN
ncbi:MAG: thiamine pyrophosphate-binding protein [Chloroflexi bacterium]|nr:thiamine pyrophosphate-binding protein [Chloroflexota bacterium]